MKRPGPPNPPRKPSLSGTLTRIVGVVVIYLGSWLTYMVLCALLGYGTMRLLLGLAGVDTHGTDMTGAARLWALLLLGALAGGFFFAGLLILRLVAPGFWRRNVAHVFTRGHTQVKEMPKGDDSG